MTYLDVRRSCELLAYLGYHTAGTDNQLSAITVTKAQRTGGNKKRNQRTVFMGHVIGPPGVGKTTFCQGLLGRSIDVRIIYKFFAYVQKVHVGVSFNFRRLNLQTYGANFRKLRIIQRFI